MERPLDSGFRRNDGSASLVIPGKAAGRDPESRILSDTRETEEQRRSSGGSHIGRKVESSSTVARWIFSCYRRLAMRYVYTCRICLALTIVLTATVFSSAAQEDKCWSTEADKGNRCEGVVNVPSSDPDLELLSFVVGEKMVAFPSSQDATLTVGFFLPDAKFLPASGTAQIQAQELRDDKHYRMRSKPQHEWRYGQWNTFSPWPLSLVLRPLGIEADNLGLTIRFGRDIENYLIPAVPYFSNRPTSATRYTLFFRADRPLKEVTYQLLRDEVAKQPLLPPQTLAGPFSANAPFLVRLPTMTTIPAGPVYLQIEGAYQNRPNGPKRWYRFYHTSEMK